MAGGRDVAVASGLGQHAAGPEQARPADEAGPQRLLDAHVEAAGVANGGEAPPQHPLEDGFGLYADPGWRTAGHGGQVHGGDRSVDMSVDEPWHQRPAAGVDDDPVVWPRDRGAVLGDFDDPVAFHPNRRPRADFSDGGVEQLRVGDDESSQTRAPSVM